MRGVNWNLLMKPCQGYKAKDRIGVNTIGRIIVCRFEKSWLYEETSSTYDLELFVSNYIWELKDINCEK